IAARLPFRECAVVVAPKQVALAVAVEVADALQVPSGVYSAVHIDIRREPIAARLPLRERAVAVAPEQVALAITVEVEDALQVPGIVDPADKHILREGVAGRLPLRERASSLPPQQVAAEVAAEVGIGSSHGHVTEGKCLHMRQRIDA